MSDDDILNELDQGLVMDQLRQANVRLSKELVKAKDYRDYMGQRIYEAMSDAIMSRPLENIVPPQPDSRKKDAEVGISVVSDWQLGKITKSYDSVVCEERIREYTEKIIELTEIQRKDHPVKEHHVFMLGDMVEGELIFPGQAHLIDSSLFRQVADDFPRIASYMITRLLQTHEKVYVHTVWGNHGYLGGRSRREMHPESNADNFAYTFLEKQFANESRVTFDISREWYQVANLGEGLRFLLLHGNNIKGFNGLPFYGYAKKIQGWSMLERKGLMEGFDYALTGHFHTPTNLYLNTVRVWVNGSTESHNAYAQEQLASMGEPCQWLLFAKPGRGVTAEYLVTLT